ncbi:hypothetical protein DYE48_17635 [Halobacillus trueperi]|uniref:Uncharacterized protein n=1 Tax=Halobacillus trueperi TaxID=156205 RepID=A0A3E0J2A1_9BACI|nr:hypothetical protein DYE48_17635 [Halobacillus trueperi]
MTIPGHGYGGRETTICGVLDQSVEKHTRSFLHSLFMRTFPRPYSHALFVQDLWLKQLYNGAGEQVFLTELGRLLLEGFENLIWQSGGGKW